MKILQLTDKNIESKHICCAITDKKRWLSKKEKLAKVRV